MNLFVSVSIAVVAHVDSTHPNPTPQEWLEKMIPYVNLAGVTFVGDVVGFPPTAHEPSWMCLMRLVPGGLTQEVRAPFERLVRLHAKEHGWRVTRLHYTRSNVTFYVELLDCASSSAASSLSKKP